MGTGSLAFIIFTFVVAQVAVLMGIGIFRQRRKYRDLESLPGEAPVARTAKEFANTETAWDGFREFLVKRRVIEDDIRSVCSFYLVPADGDMEGVDYHHSGRIDLQLLRSTLKLMRYQFYVCGPRQMMEALVPALAEWGVATDDIFYESFGPASLIKHEIPARQVTTGGTAAQAFTITFSKSGKSILWDPSADSLLEFAESNGIEVDCHQEPDVDVDSGHCLLCITTPKSNLILVA